MCGYDGCVIAFALGAVLAAAPIQAPAQSEPAPLELRVNRAIALAVGYLKGLQQPDGRFPGHDGQHPGGTTALAAFALAKSGVRRGDEALVRAVRALAGIEMQSTYSASVHLLMCEALGDWDLQRAAAQKSLDFLVKNQQQGVWSYPWAHLCGSNTQFALMGLRAAHRMGLSVPEETLVDAAEGIWHFQDRLGGGIYSEGGRPYAGMTAALLSDCAALEEIGAASTLVRSSLRRHEKDRKAAESWLAERFELSRNTYANGSWTPFWHYAYLWAVERWCGLTGREEFAGRDWYREGAAWLVDTQAADGAWTSDDKPFENTCLALLFLRRATVSTDGELEEIYEQIDRHSGAAARLPERPGPLALRLTDWWLAGPWQGEEDGKILVEPPFDPAQVEPRERNKLAKRAWERVRLKPDGWTDLHELTEREGDWQLWCLVTTLAYEPAPDVRAPAQAFLWLELEDGWDVWLDGKRLSRERRVGSAINGDVRIALELAPGEHRLVVLVEDVGGAAAFGARLSDATNGPPPATLSAWAVPPAERRR